MIKLSWWVGLITVASGTRFLLVNYVSIDGKGITFDSEWYLWAVITLLLALKWLPLSARRSTHSNILFVAVLIED